MNAEIEALIGVSASYSQYDDNQYDQFGTIIAAVYDGEQILCYVMGGDGIVSEQRLTRLCITGKGRAYLNGLFE